MGLETNRRLLRSTAIVCAALLIPGEIPVMAQEQSPPVAGSAEVPKPVPAEQLDSLVAPIALYPDSLLAQVLAASTYPLELVQLQQWLTKHPDLKDKALADAVQKEKWDPSIQGLAALPEVAKKLADNIQWTQELGDAFLAQQSDVMDAVQRMRAKAKDDGKLKSSEQMTVETKVVESKNVVVIEQADPKVVYVPSYNPEVVWGPPVYAYPPVYYPPPGYYAAGMALSFGVGIAMGAMFSGGWGYNCGWGGNNTININNNNNFNRNTVNGGNRTNVGGGNKWQHSPQHRGGAPYGDRATANKFGGSARGDSSRARQNAGQQGAGNRGSGAGQGGRTADRAGAAGGNRGGGVTADRAGAAGGNRGGGGNADRTGAGSGNRGGGGSADRVGNRQVPSGGSSKGGGAFGGGGGGGGGAARSSSSRGASSMGGGSRGGGGGRRR